MSSFPLSSKFPFQTSRVSKVQPCGTSQVRNSPIPVPEPPSHHEVPRSSSPANRGSWPASDLLASKRVSSQPCDRPPPPPPPPPPRSSSRPPRLPFRSLSGA